MINLKQFLLNSNLSGGTYALVTYNNNIEPTHFANMGTSFNQDGDSDDWFLESPCELYKIADVGNDINTFTHEYMNEIVCLEERVDAGT